MTVTALTVKMKSGSVTSAELVSTSLETIHEMQPIYNAFITVDAEGAKKAAAQLDKELSLGHIRGPLHGIPIAVKDLINTKDIRTTMGSKLYENHLPDADATVVTRLKEAGAVILGKTNTHEFAYGPIGDRSYFGACRNPYNPEKIAGGSSSGSGSAVGAGMVPAAIGTDTGGSIRIPASACGVVGMKPTFGLVSKSGSFPLAYTLDHVGPMTGSVSDNALILSVIAGHDSADPYSLNQENRDYTEKIGDGLAGKTIGVPDWYFVNVDAEVRKAVEQSLDLFEEMGASVQPVQMPILQEISKFQVITIQAEAAAVHQQTLKHKGSVDEEVYERIVASGTVKGFEYVESQIKREGIIREYNKVFEKVDVLVTPTLPVLPTDIGQREVRIGEFKETVRSALLRLTSPTNYTGNPSLSLPCALSESGLPIGLQLIGKHGTEAELYQFAYALEQKVDFRNLVSQSNQLT
ncbi:amidase [Bhargavaea massiliensis]|uniref:amidase n=1 Tax=Bhargavaea massiliensis TaxID=2697500 RepID=UPI001BCEB1DF|nr:amidase [Bhargavaea massiliensis]